MDTRYSSVRTVVYLLVASAFTACAGATKPTATAPDTEKQRKVRTDLEQCDAALTGNKPYLVAVTPEGKWSFQVIGISNADTMLMCMASKGYSGKRIELDSTGYFDRRRYSGEGEPSR